MRDFSTDLNKGSNRNRKRRRQRRPDSGDWNQQNLPMDNPQGQQGSIDYNLQDTQQRGKDVRASLANAIGHAAFVAASTGSISRRAAHNIIDTAFRSRYGTGQQQTDD